MARDDILFIAPTRIGDAVLASALLRHIGIAHPGARVTLATSTLAAPLFEGYPLLSRLIPMTKQPYKRHWLTLGQDTFYTRWGALWDLRNSILSRVLLSRHCYRFMPTREALPKVQQYEAAFHIPALPYPMLWPRAQDKTAAAQLLPDGTRALVIAPIANWEPKQWPLAQFATLALRLLKKSCAGWRPVVICAGHERDQALPLLETLREFMPLDLTRGEAHLLTIYATLQRAHGFIGNDSGLMHMAAAAGIPSLGIFGPTDSAVYQPWGPCAHFIHAPKNDLSVLSVETVAEAFETLLRTSQ